MTGVSQGLMFSNHFKKKNGYWYTCVRSFVFLCSKGNILAILKELLENPLCCEDEFVVH